ncbi:DUF1259 domain-containing protein [Paenibacillus azoreducens]|uniref:DUF1259 domain-containing protein n=1 Tax=Paenibacillus azoreducens TaxID=116718 RepID=A0A919YB94_9BACL|nr:DUF1259 domain-containing protein [Paenibacillus azoreducens]GIO45367.1 hypothetical protein J34TS1_01320 [Paenibacillus azoreducens]
MKKIVLLFTAISLLLIPSGTVLGEGNQDCRIFEKVFNTDIKQENGVCKLGITRKNIPISNLGVPLSPEAVELSFGANFEKVGDKTAVIGEFALLGSEVTPVIDALRKGNIDISALHNHLIGEQPRILFLHFQALGDAETLARTVKQAIDAAGGR